MNWTAIDSILVNVFHFAERQLWGLHTTLYYLFHLGALEGKSVAATILVVINLFNFTFFDTPIVPYGPELDLEGYSLVYADEFDGDAIDTEAWDVQEYAMRGGYWSAEQISLKDGNLVFTGEYIEDGKFGPGWYAGGLILNEQYKYGYFEIKAKINYCDSMWSAFWLCADGCYDPEISKGGAGAAEIDIMESNSMAFGNKLSENGITQCIWCAGVENAEENYYKASNGLDGIRLGTWKGNNIYNEWNTYGLKWDENGYTFYVNGVATRTTTFGLSHVPEMVRLDLEVPSSFRSDDRSHKCQYVVDYIRIYQADSPVNIPG